MLKTILAGMGLIMVLIFLIIYFFVCAASKSQKYVLCIPAGIAATSADGISTLLDLIF